MKTCVNVLLLIIICCLKSPGQQSTNIDAPHPKKFISQIEIFTGPSAVGVHDNSAYSKYGTLKIGFQAGVGLSHSISRSVDCNLKFYFERKGFRQETEAFFPPDIYNSPPTSNLPPVSTQVIGDLNIDYVSASISPRYFFGKKKYGYIDIGIYGSQLIKSQITVTETQNGQLKRKTLLNQDGTYKDYDLGLSLSLGYAFRFLKKLTLGPKLLWNYGMIDIVNLQPGLTSMKNNSVVFLVNANF